MVMKTVECVLDAPSETLEKFWHWTEKYTLLVNAVLEKVADDSRFPQWLAKGNIPQIIIDKEFLGFLKSEKEYADLPKLFYVSAKLVVSRIYKSWFAIHQKSFYRLQQKKRWLSIVRRVLDNEPNDPSHEEICGQAAQWLSYCEIHDLKKTKKKSAWLQLLMQSAEKQTERVDLLAIAYLLLNNLKIPEEPFVKNSLKKRFTKKEIEIERLDAKINQQLPKGRDPLGSRYLEHLTQALALPKLSNDPQRLVVELQSWKQQIQLPNFNALHYPLVIESSGKFYWSTIDVVSTRDFNTNDAPTDIQSQSVLGVSFSGFADCVFQIKCSRRQLYIFRRFQEEGNYFHRQINEGKKTPNVCPPPWGLFPLRAGQVLWRPSHKYKSKKPWVIHHLHLQCNIDEQLLSQEGTAKVCAEKIEATKRKLQPFLDKSPETLKKNQRTCQKRNQSSLHRLQYSSLNRPHTSPYIGNPELTLGVSLSRELPLQASIVNKQTRHLLATITAPQLLQWEGFREKLNPCRESQFSDLIERVHRQRIQWRKIREKEYSKGKLRQSKKLENLGTYCDRLIAKRLIQWAQTYHVGEIILPSPKGIKDNIEASLQTLARLKFPANKQLQKKYTQSIRLRCPHWSYSRLIKCISDCAERRELKVNILQIYDVAASLEQSVDIACAHHQFLAPGP